MINLKELENLAISPELPLLGEVATLKQMGDKVIINLYFFDTELAEHLEYLVTARYPGIKTEVHCQTIPKKTQPSVSVNNRINNIIAVASGKGGVGKSSTTVNLALAMAASGAKVGILDADIYGPSQPTMLGRQESPQMIAKNTMCPIRVHGIESNSIGYLVDKDAAMVWRAPVVVAALQQLMNDTAWGSTFTDTEQDKNSKLDYLFIDLPPGTGDVQLSIAQQIPVTGAVTVTTPQDIALIDAKRAINMFNKMQIDNFGIIENMSTYICDNCGHESPIFGQHGGRDMAAEFAVDFLGEIPLDIHLRESLDSGYPIVTALPNHPISQRYHDIAKKIAIAIAKKPKRFSQAFGKIAVENSL